MIRPISDPFITRGDAIGSLRRSRGSRTHCQRIKPLSSPLSLPWSTRTRHSRSWEPFQVSITSEIFLTLDELTCCLTISQPERHPAADLIPSAPSESTRRLKPALFVFFFVVNNAPNPDRQHFWPRQMAAMVKGRLFKVQFFLPQSRNIHVS